VVYADDSFGKDGLAGAQKGLVAAKLTPVLQEKFDRAKPDFAPIAAKLSKADAQAVLIIASGSSAVVEAASTPCAGQARPRRS
jgi:branched-chain amino acid transport system substrate-binding protein